MYVNVELILNIPDFRAIVKCSVHVHVEMKVRANYLMENGGSLLLIRVPFAK